MSGPSGDAAGTVVRGIRDTHLDLWNAPAEMPQRRAALSAEHFESKWVPFRYLLLRFDPSTAGCFGCCVSPGGGQNQNQRRESSQHLPNALTRNCPEMFGNRQT